jgi:hypothetical protein
MNGERTGSAFHSDSIPTTYGDFAGLEHILLGDLRALLAEPLTQTSRVWMEKVIDILLDLLRSQFAAEEADGYLQDVIDLHPHWHERVAALQRQHAELYDSLAALRADLNEAHLPRTAAAQVRSGLRKWMDRFQSHQDAEIRLLSAAGLSSSLAL